MTTDDDQREARIHKQQATWARRLAGFLGDDHDKLAQELAAVFLCARMHAGYSKKQCDLMLERLRDVLARVKTETPGDLVTWSVFRAVAGGPQSYRGRARASQIPAVGDVMVLRGDDGHEARVTIRERHWFADLDHVDLWPEDEET